jgi:transposase
MRSRGKKVSEVSKELRVSMGAVFKWQRMYINESGVSGLKKRKKTGWPPIKGEAARKVIPEVLKERP